MTEGAPAGGPPVRTLRIVLAYDGARFAGWQRQRAGASVAAAVEKALAPLAAGPVRVVGSGRTDAGVHALRQVASARIATRLPVERIRAALDSRLPPEVSALEVADAPPGFDARRSARGKRYAYGIRLAALRSPFWDARLWRIPRPLDVPAMREAARALLGSHDFSAFAGALSRGRRPERTIRRLHIFRRGERLWLVVEGDGFLHRMVRAIVGTLVEVGIGKLSPAEVRAILAGRDRRRAGASAPPHGLYLLRVLYVPPRLHSASRARSGSA